MVPQRLQFKSIPLLPLRAQEECFLYVVPETEGSVHCSLVFIFKFPK